MGKSMYIFDIMQIIDKQTFRYFLKTSLEDYYKYLGKYKKPVSTETPTFVYHKFPINAI